MIEEFINYASKFISMEEVIFSIIVLLSLAISFGIDYFCRKKVEKEAKKDAF